jgi:pyruvate dehydrogenase (quinone)
VVVDAITVPEVPPLPPHISLEQARNFMTAVIKDDRAGAMVRQSFRSMIERFHPHPVGGGNGNGNGHHHGNGHRRRR